MNKINYVLLIIFMAFSSVIIAQPSEEIPRFPGCEDTEKTIKEKERCSRQIMNSFISTHLRYPSQAVKNRTEGKVVIRFVINAEGDIVDPKVIEDIGDGCGEECLRIVKMMPKWRPAKHLDKSISVHMTLPFRFKLLEAPKEVEKPKEQAPMLKVLTITTWDEIFCNEFSIATISQADKKAMCSKENLINIDCSGSIALSDFTITQYNKGAKIKRLDPHKWQKQLKKILKKTKPFDKFTLSYSNGKKRISKLIEVK